MKLKVVVIDLELSKRQKRIGATLLAAAVALCASVASADLPKTFTKGGTLKAADLNASFSALDQRITAFERRPRSRVGVKAVLPYSVEPNTTERLTFGMKLYDDTEDFDATSSTFIAAEDGDYAVCLSLVGLYYTSYVKVFVEGTPRGTLLYGGVLGSAGCVTVRAEAGDAIDLRLDATGSGDTVTGSDNDAWLTLSRLD